MIGGPNAQAKGRPPWHAYGIGAALAATLILGLWMRWGLAGSIGLPWNLDHLRHAHSHLGYYGVLFPLAWLGWRRAGAPIPGARLLSLYALSTALSFFGFLRVGYGPEAIAGSTVVGAVWLVSGWGLRHRMATLFDPLGAMLLGVVAAEACVPPIAIFLRRDPALAHGFVATFLALLLFGVMVPSALAARGVRLPWPGLLLTGLLGAAALGVWPSTIARAGLAGYGLLLLSGAVQRGLPLHLRLAWSAVALGLLATALGLLPNARPVVIGAIHFTLLSPVLISLVVGWLDDDQPQALYLLYHGCVALLGGPLAAQGVGAGAWTLWASALGGTGVLLWWTVILFRRLWSRARGGDQRS